MPATSTAKTPPVFPFQGVALTVTPLLIIRLLNGLELESDHIFGGDDEEDEIRMIFYGNVLNFHYCF